MSTTLSIYVNTVSFRTEDEQHLRDADKSINRVRGKEKTVLLHCDKLDGQKKQSCINCATEAAKKGNAELLRMKELGVPSEKMRVATERHVDILNSIQKHHPIANERTKSFSSTAKTIMSAKPSSNASSLSDRTVEQTIVKPEKSLLQKLSKMTEGMDAGIPM